MLFTFVVNGDDSEIIDALAAGVVRLDAAGSVLLMNLAAEKILGMSAETSMREGLGQRFPRIDAIASAARTEGSDERAEWSFERRRGDSVIIGYQVTRVPVGRGTDFLVLFQDITRWTRLRQERDRLLQLATVGETLPTLLHELKNPLAAISSTVELLLEESQSGQLQDDLYAILREVRRMRLAFDGIGLVGEVSVRGDRHEAIDLAIRDAAQILAARAKSMNIEIATRVSDMPLLPFSSAAVRALVFNLLRNALDACDRGGHVNIDARFDNTRQSLCVEVKDDGRGMTTEVLARCRELFFTTKANGSGIGLALCARVVEQAGGAMSIDSAPERGTRIAISLPIAASAAPPENRRPVWQESTN